MLNKRPPDYQNNDLKIYGENHKHDEQRRDRNLFRISTIRHIYIYIRTIWKHIRYDIEALVEQSSQHGSRFRYCNLWWTIDIRDSGNEPLHRVLWRVLLRCVPDHRSFLLASLFSLSRLPPTLLSIRATVSFAVKKARAAVQGHGRTSSAILSPPHPRYICYTRPLSLAAPS